MIGATPRTSPRNDGPDPAFARPARGPSEFGENIASAVERLLLAMSTSPAPLEPAHGGLEGSWLSTLSGSELVTSPLAKTTGDEPEGVAAEGARATAEPCHDALWMPELAGEATQLDDTSPEASSWPSESWPEGLETSGAAVERPPVRVFSALATPGSCDPTPARTRAVAVEGGSSPNRSAGPEPTADVASGLSARRSGESREDRDTTERRSSDSRRLESRTAAAGATPAERLVETVSVTVPWAGGETRPTQSSPPVPTAPLELAHGEPLPRELPDGPGAPYVVRVGPDLARVELVHPELGRLDVEVRAQDGRVDVAMLARALSASIALRAGEELLRGDLRARGQTLRSFRVRTQSTLAAGDSSPSEEEAP